MLRRFTLAALSLSLFAAAATARDAAPKSALSGHYVEARNCDVWTGPCFANADFNLTGKNAVLAWKVNTGSFDGVQLDGLGIVAVVLAHNTLGLEQQAAARTVLIVDRRASATQRDALIRLAKKQAGTLLDHVAAVHTAAIKLDACTCKDTGCAELDAGVARIKTRCLHGEHDKVCGNETAFYPPLATGVQVVPAAAVEHVFRGTGLGQTWSDSDRRGAYVGTFRVD